jgi:hypothetical protein
MAPLVSPENTNWMKSWNEPIAAEGNLSWSWRCRG